LNGGKAASHCVRLSALRASVFTACLRFVRAALSSLSYRDS
jgi:hypothetical protein